jgi:hypothetical protein
LPRRPAETLCFLCTEILGRKVLKQFVAASPVLKQILAKSPTQTCTRLVILPHYSASAAFAVWSSFAAPRGLGTDMAFSGGSHGYPPSVRRYAGQRRQHQLDAVSHKGPLTPNDRSTSMVLIPGQAIAIPGSFRSPFRADYYRHSEVNPITDSGPSRSV